MTTLETSTGPTGGAPDPEPSPEPPPAKGSSFRWRWVALALVAGSLLFFAGVKVAGVDQAPASAAPAPSPTAPAVVVMPNVVGMTAQAAADRLALLAGIPTTYVEGGAAYRYTIVTSQSPAAGTPITSTTRVDVYNGLTTYSSAPAASSAPTPQTGPSTTFGAGTYEVGTGVSQIPPGTYQTAGASWCYWARLKDTTGDFSAIKANGNPGGNTTVTIKADDGAFQINGTCIFNRK